jgi:serine/threonine protein kinase
MTYEMLTGEPPFTGLNSQAIVAKVLTEQPPPLRPKRPSVPPAVEHAVLVALRSSPPTASTRRRTSPMPSTARQGRHLRRDGGNGRRPSSPPSPPSPSCLARRRGTAPHRRGRRRLAYQQCPPRPRARHPLRPRLPRGAGPPVACSRSRRTQHSWCTWGRPDSGQQLWVKERDQYEATPLAGTGGTSSPTVSPDGKWVAFVQKGQLKEDPHHRRGSDDAGGLGVCQRRHGVAGRRLSGLYHS